VAGPLEGTVLDTIPSWHTTWKQWQEWHPDTVVMLPPDNPRHTDPRHGHGREEYFERPGLAYNEAPLFLPTITVSEYDERIEEQRLILGITEKVDPVRAYPINEVKKHGSVVNDVLDDEPVVVWTDPRPAGFTMAAFSRQLDDQVLEFETHNGAFVDKQTGSTWHLQGHATTGPLAGKKLRPVRWIVTRWAGWSFAFQETELWTSDKKESSWDIKDGVFEPLISALSEQGISFNVLEEMFDVERLQGTDRGIVADLNDDRFRIYHFKTNASASEAAYALPYSTQVGPYVLQSWPVDQWTDWTKTQRKPDNEISWSPLIDEASGYSDSIRSRLKLKYGLTQDVEVKTIAVILECLKSKGYKLKNIWLVPSRSLDSKAEAMMEISIGQEKFVIHRFSNAQDAQQYASRWPAALSSGCFVLRSTPLGMYYVAKYEIGEKPANEVKWSSLIKDSEFQQILDMLTKEK
jgi:hypothetical protein